jgi:hypothetical protein
MAGRTSDRIDVGGPSAGSHLWSHHLWPADRFVRPVNHAFATRKHSANSRYFAALKQAEWRATAWLSVG